MGDDADKCFTMALLLNFLYEYRQAQHEIAGSPESSGLQHLAIFEEAHRVLRATRGGGGDANPQAKMGEMFADFDDIPEVGKEDLEAATDEELEKAGLE